MCEFAQLPDGRVRCGVCGWESSRPRGVDLIRVCGAQPAGKEVARLAKRYVSAVARWIAAGRPTRTDDEVGAIFAGVCVPCEHFNEDKQTCRVCGCRVGRGKVALVNKLRMLTETCPRGKWQ